MEPLYVVGAGGIGCAVGYALRAAGVRAVFVEVDHAKLEWAAAHGVRVDRRDSLPAEILHFDEWHPPAEATVLLCTKCYNNAAVLARLPSSATLIPIQNGFDASLAAWNHALEGVASFVSECYPQRTHTRITRRGQLHIGYRHANGTSPAPAIATALAHRAPFRVTVVPNILPYKYTKLMYNAAISPLAAAAGLDNGQLLAVPQVRHLFFALLRENYAILREAGVPLGKIGIFHPDTVSRILRRRSLANSLAWAFYPTLRRTYCSMSGDLPTGCTEIDYYNGHLIALAGDRPCPLNRRVYELVKRMERERLVPALARLDELTPTASECRPG
jgi:2-dehydropantoate 2-reductase